MIAEERAPAKVNLVLRVGPRRGDGLHELCSLFASIELEDRLELHAQPMGRMSWSARGWRARTSSRGPCGCFGRPRRMPSSAPIRVEIDKAIPVAAGLGGGSADAAAALRAANRLARRPAVRAGPARARGAPGVRRTEPAASPPCDRDRHWRAAGARGASGDRPRADATPAGAGDRRRLRRAGQAAGRRRAGGAGALDPEPLRELAGHTGLQLATALENDLEAAALSLRPELADGLGSARARSAPSPLGSPDPAPPLFGVFASAGEAAAAASELTGAIATRTR